MSGWLPENVRKLGHAYEDGGIGLVLKRAGRRIADINSAVWYERDLSLPVRDVRPGPPLHVDFFSFDRTAAWLKGEEDGWMVPAPELSLAKEEGHWLAGLVHDSRLVGSMKIGHGRVLVADFSRIVRLPDRTAYHTDIYITPSFRGRGAAAFLLSEAMCFLRGRGFARLRCHIPAWNSASLRLHEGAGFRSIGRIRCLRLLGRSFLAGSPQALRRSLKAAGRESAPSCRRGA